MIKKNRSTAHHFTRASIGLLSGILITPFVWAADPYWSCEANFISPAPSSTVITPKVSLRAELDYPDKAYISTAHITVNGVTVFEKEDSLGQINLQLTSGLITATLEPGYNTIVIDVLSTMETPHSYAYSPVTTVSCAMNPLPVCIADPSSNYKPLDECIQFYFKIPGSKTSEGFVEIGTYYHHMGDGCNPGWTYWTAGKCEYSETKHLIPYNGTCQREPCAASKSMVLYYQPEEIEPSEEEIDPSKNNGLPDTCAGNPLNVAIGNKYQHEVDLPRTQNSLLHFERSYNSTLVKPTGLGQNWTHTYSAAFYNSMANATRVAAFRPDGRLFFFRNSTGVWAGDADVADRLERLIDHANQFAGWRYSIAQDQRVETYNAQGKLTSIVDADGKVQTLTYTDNLLTQVQDHTGRTLLFGYDAEGRIISLTDPLGQITTYAYTPDGLLARVHYPDGTQRQYHYNELAFINNGTSCSEHPAGFPAALTGITDQHNTRYATFTYDCQGRATGSSHPGGVDQVKLTFNTSDSTSTTVTDPLGNQHTYGFEAIQGVARRTTASQPAGSGCGAATARFDYDDSGNIIARTDFNGTKTCSAFELSYNREIIRAEGLPADQNCATALYTSPMGVAQRRINTKWHPYWPLALKRAEPYRITSYGYNGLFDPANTNIVMNCAPANARLPDGQPLAVLCKKTEQLTNNADGSAGFNAATVGTPRITQWTYDANGRVLTREDTDGRILTYAYAPETTATHTVGDLLSVSDQMGTITTYTRYDRAGRLLESQDTNGVVTRYAYDVRGQLTEYTTADRTLHYTYTPVGQLRTVTQPDGYTLTHAYDAAHRLTGISDNLGNRLTYTLDAAGNLLHETTVDANHSLTRAITRHYDALQRVEREIRGE